MKKRTLYIPSRVSLRNEIWRGLSIKDAIKSVIIGTITAGFSVVLHFTVELDILWCALASFVAAAFGATVLTRYDSGMSITDIIRISIKFAKEQKRFYYIYRRR